MLLLSERPNKMNEYRITKNTFDFQAPEFYLKHGYEQVFELSEYPKTGKRHYYKKELQ